MEEDITFYENQKDLDSITLVNEEHKELKVRLDKWLWAARFFTTRALARVAVDAGKVFYNNQICKPSKEIQLKSIITVKRGNQVITVEITGLSTRRRNSKEATQLYKLLEEKGINVNYNNSYSRKNSKWKNNNDKDNSSKDKFYTSETSDVPTKPKRVVRFLRRTVAKSTNNNNSIKKPLIVHVDENDNSNLKDEERGNF